VLEDQLLNLVIKHEIKEIEIKKELVIEKIYQNKETLKELKKSFIIEIISCIGLLINNLQLYTKLEDIKTKIDSTSTKLKSFIDSMSDIDQSRSVYKSISKKGALFYMILNELKVIDQLYQFSIDSYMKLFLNSIDSAKNDDIILNRISNIIEQFTNDFFEYCCISIYEKHNTLFLFQVACTLDKDAGILLDSELIFFIKGNTDIEKNNILNTTSWISNKCWKDIIYLSTNFEKFSNLIEHICNNNENWKKVN